MPASVGAPRQMLRRLREVMAEHVSAQARLDKVVVLIAFEAAKANDQKSCEMVIEPDRLYTPSAAAERLSVTTQQLQQWRDDSLGPVFCTLPGDVVRYPGHGLLDVIKPAAPDVSFYRDPREVFAKV